MQIPIQSIKLNQPYKTIEELNEKIVGGDMGLNNLIMLINRKKIEPPKYLRKLEKRLSIEQRKDIDASIVIRDRSIYYQNMLKELNQRNIDKSVGMNPRPLIGVSRLAGPTKSAHLGRSS